MILKSSTLHTDALTREFNRLWLDAEADNRGAADVNAATTVVAEEAERLEKLSRDDLLVKYQAQIAQRPARPTRRNLNAYEYDRNPLVIAIARKRASHQCEVHNCSHPTFETIDGVAYTEVHHIIPLADGAPRLIASTGATAIGGVLHWDRQEGMKAPYGALSMRSAYPLSWHYWWV